VLAGIGAGIAAGVLARPARAAEQAVVTLSSTSYANAAIFMAEKLGLFAKHGVALKLVVVDSGSLAVSALLSGSAQYTASGVSDALAAAAHGQSLKLVANVYHGLSGSVIIGKAAAQRLGLSEKSPLDARRKALVGLSVAIPSATSSYVPPTVGAAMLAGGKPDLVYMAQPTMVAALQAGAVQAIMCGSPFWEPAVTGGFGSILLDGPAGEFPADDAPVSTTALITTGDHVRSDPAQVKAVQAALADLADLIRSDPQRAEAGLAQAYPKLDSATLTLGFKRNSANWAHPGFDAADVQHELAIMMKNRPMPGLNAVKPQDLLIG
jgi:ABC-type nitrate/sulfonate/bicarbonate transport system substrate-binding protein